jgi:hypothetical protein
MKCWHLVVLATAAQWLVAVTLMVALDWRDARRRVRR